MANWYRLTENEISSFHKGKQFNPDMFRAFIRANKFDKAKFSGATDYARLVKEGRFPRGHSSWEEPNKPPYMDHTRIFKSAETGVLCITYQPYKKAVDNCSEIEQWADNNGLKAKIYSPEYSWYYPGATYLVIIHLPTTEIYLN